MSQYRLQLLFDNSVLAQIKQAGQQVMLAKPVNGDTPNVVWQSIDPFPSTEVVWSEEYGIYASTTAIEHGATITKIAETGFPAQEQGYYTLNPNNVFDDLAVDASVPIGSYQARNHVSYANYPVLTFGLTQSALINQKPADRKPISATPVLATQVATMTPFTKVYIWLQADFASETIITEIQGDPSVAKFGGGVEEIILKYSPQLGKFIPSQP